MKKTVWESDDGAREKFKSKLGLVKIPALDCTPARLVFSPRMPFSWSLANTLRATALVLLLGGLGVWVATGAHLGLTQTSLVTMKRDEVTGIDYPERRPGFVAGVEVPLGTAAGAILFALLSLVAERRRTTP